MNVMDSSRGFSRPIITLATMILGAMFVLAYTQIYYTNKTASLVARTQEVLYNATNVLAIIAEDKTASRGYALTGNASFLEPMAGSRTIIHGKIDSLRQLVSNNVTQKKRVDSLQSYADKSFLFEDTVIRIIKTKGIQNALILLSGCTSDDDMDNIRKFAHNIQNEEIILLQKRKQDEANATNLLEGIVLSLIVFFIVLIFVYRRREKAVNAANKSNREYLELLNLQVNQSNDAIYMIDTKRKIKRWNLGAEKMYGFTETEVLDKDLNEVLNTTISKAGVEKITSTIAQTGYWSGEFRRKTKTNEDIFVAASVTGIKGKDGHITGYLGVNLNTTAQKKLSEKVDHLASIVAQSSEAIISIDFQDRILSWNRGAENLHGYSREEALGRSAVELGILKLTAAEKAADLREVMEHGRSTREVQLNRKNGTSFPASVSITAIKNDAGDITSFVVFAKDITISKQAEEQLKNYNAELERKVQERTSEVVKNEKRFRSLIHNSFDIVAVTNESLKIFYLSPSGTRITGWTNQEMIHSDFGAKIHPEETAKAARIHEELIANPGRQIKCQCRYRHKDGHYLVLEGTVVNLLQDDDIKGIVLNFHDVTERALAEQKLVAREKFFRALLENDHDLITMIGKTGEIIYRSPSASRIVGWTDDEMMHADIRTNVHPNDKSRAGEIIRDLVINRGKTVNILVRNLHKQGHYVWLEGVGTNLLDEEHVNAIVFNFRDVSERMEAQLNLVKNERRFRTLTEKNHDIITLFDESYKVTYKSESFRRITGWEPEEMINRHATEHVHPDDLPAARAFLAELVSDPEKSGTTLLFRYRHKDGHYLWMEGIGRNLLADPALKSFVFNYRDVTERVEASQKLVTAQKHFQALIEFNHDIISIVGEDYRFRYRSPSAIRVTGWTEEDIIKGDVREFTHPDDLQSSRESWYYVIVNPGKPRNVSFRFRHKDGHYLWLEGVAINLFYNESINGVLYNLRDVTDRVEAREKLANSEIRFRSLIEYNLDAISMTDVSGKVLYRSPTAIKILGEHFRGNLRYHAHPDDYDRICAVRIDTLTKPGVPMPFIGRFDLPEPGKYRWIEGLLINMLQVAGVEAIVSNFRDVTERKEVEERLISSEIRFRSLIENSAEGITLSDEHSNLIYRSPGARKIAGEDLENDSSINGVHPDDLQSIQIKFAEALRHPGKPVPFMGRYRKSSGTYFWMEGTFTNHKNTTGINAIVTNYRDVTERMEAEEKLKSSEGLYREVLGRISEGFMAMDRDFRINFINTVAEQILEQEPGFLVGKKMNDEFPAGAGKPFFNAYLQSVETGCYVQITEFSTALNKWIEGRLYPSQSGVSIFFEDVTLRKKKEDESKSMEEKYVNLIQRIKEGFISMDKNFRYTYINKQAADMLKRDTVQMIGKTMWQEFPDLIGTETYSAFQAAMQRQKYHGIIQYYEPLDLWQEIHIYPSEQGLSVLIRDITEKKKLEINLINRREKENLRLTAATLEAQEKERNKIGQELHDNVNQILAATKLFLSIAKDNPQKERDFIDSSMQNLQVAIDENKKISHLLVTPDFNSISLTAMVRKLTDDMLTHSGITVLIHTDDFDEARLSGEQKLTIYRIAQEQSTNIVKYSRATEVCIDLSIRGGVFGMIIEDNGEGSDTLSLTNGIGLSNIKNRVQVFNGTSTILTGIGRGFRMEISLPCGE